MAPTLHLIHPQGGTEFYAQPLDITIAQNVTLQYSVYFSGDFDFVKGGKLPGYTGVTKGARGETRRSSESGQ